MTYQVKYENESKAYCMFEIKYYLKQTESMNWASEEREKLWHSEINSLPRIEGITMFLKDKLKDENFDVREFIAYSHQIEELRSLLYDVFKNKLSPMDEAQVFHYQDFGKVLRGILDRYCKKYDLFLNID